MYVYKRTPTTAASCQVFCGPRSFLVNLNGNLVCQRDYSPRYWGSVTDIPTIQMNNYCRPDVLQCSETPGTININFTKNRCSDNQSDLYPCCFRIDNLYSLLVRNWSPSPQSLINTEP